MAQFQGLRQHKAGLGHGPFGGVHQQDDSVNHLQDALHLAAKVGVARRVYDVDFYIAVLDGGVLGGNGDAPLPLQVVGVHDPIHHGLIFPVDTGLLQQLVHQGGLAVVHVGDDGDISQLFIFHAVILLTYGKTTRSPIAHGARRMACIKYCAGQELVGGETSARPTSINNFSETQGHRRDLFHVAEEA